MSLKKIFLFGLIGLLATAGSASAGSLWQDNASLFTDPPPPEIRIGDIVHIRISERTSALTDWKSEREKEWQISGEVTPTTSLSVINDFTKLLPFLDYKYENEWSADNNAERSTVISANVSVQVVEVLPNGNLVLAGEKVLKVNNEEQTIIMRGVVRRSDVSENFMIASEKIADANIRVVGTLSFSDEERPGFLPRFLTFVSNFLF